MKKIYIFILLTFSFFLSSNDIDPLESMLESVILDAGDIVEGGSLTVYDEIDIKEDPREFIKRYYKNVKDIPIDDSYNLLSDRFKAKNGTFENYQQHFASFSSIKVIDMIVLEVTLDNQKVKVETKVEYIKEGNSYKEIYVLTLMYSLDHNGWIFH